MTHSQAESKQRAAVAMLQRFGNDEDAERFEAMSPEDYAKHRGAELISNPNRKERVMAKRKTAPSYNDLVDRVNELEAELEQTEEERDALAEQVEQIEEVLGVETEEIEEDEEDSD